MTTKAIFNISIFFALFTHGVSAQQDTMVFNQMDSLDREQGVWRQYFSNGKIGLLWSYKDGVRNGRCINYRSSVLLAQKRNTHVQQYIFYSFRFSWHRSKFGRDIKE
jgi:antitoxin component YwqK of YwqJK toxin-antitoxin module